MFEDGIDWAESHPFLMAVLIFLVFFVGYQYLKKKSSASAALPGTTTPNTTYYDYSTATTTVNSPGVTGPAGPPEPKPKPPTPTPEPKPKPPTPTPAPVPPPPVPPPPRPTATYVTVQPWPSPLSTLWGIAQSVGKSLGEIEALNPQYSSNWNLIYAGQKVRTS